ncbi:MAG: hypothetical protein AB7F94_11235 [Nitrospira sp.]
MADAAYSKRRASAARQKRLIEEETQKLREFVAELPFNKLILLQERWERQQGEVQFKPNRDEKIQS